jgi:arylsulfatase A-like enzyme
MLFKNTYCQYAICNPSRTSLLSGKRPDATGVTNNKEPMRAKLGASYKFLPEYFHAYNYRTERFGKIVCSDEKELKWDNALEIKTKHYNVSGAPIWWIDTVSETEKETVGGQLIDEVVKKLEQPVSQPYFYALGLTTHNPYTPILDAWNRTGDSSKKILLPVDSKRTFTNVKGNSSDNIHLPNTPSNDTADIPEIARDKDLLKFSTTEWKNFRHAYYAEVSQMDASLGVLLDELDKKNLWSNTVVVFYSDHGVHLGEHQGFWLKKTLFEESLRVPFVICAPGKKTGVSDKLVELVDIFSTLTELCGLPKPPGQEGISLVPLLNNPDIEWKKAIFAQVSTPATRGNFIEARAVRTQNFHYNSWDKYGEELYNLEKDPNEYTNLIDNPAYAAVLDTMRKFLAGGWISALPNTTLPATFINFNGFVENKSAFLTWSVTNEINSRGFEVEKSVDGRSFELIDFVMSNGNSSQANTYSYRDNKILSGSNYYRIKQVDKDASFKYSSTIKLNYANFNWNILGNPSKNNSWVQIQLDKESKVDIRVFDLSGHLVQRIDKGYLKQGTYSIPILEVAAPSGMYIVKLSVNDATFSKKTVK